MAAPLEQSFPAWVTITDPAAAQVLASPQEMRFLNPFIARERLISEAARELEVAPLLMYRRSVRLERLGLIRVTRTAPRAGKPVRYYRSVADAFFVPFRATNADTLETLLLQNDDHRRRRLLAGLARSFRERTAHDGAELGLRWFRDELGRVTMIHALGSGETNQPGLILSSLADGAPATWSDWSTMYLEYSQAKGLQRELAALYQKYFRVDAEPGTRRAYMVRLAMAPVDD
jgi:hypothetical protein